MRKGQKRKKPCRRHHEKTILAPISKEIAQGRNTQMKAKKENAKKKHKARSCLSEYRPEAPARDEARKTKDEHKGRSAKQIFLPIF